MASTDHIDRVYLVFKTHLDLGFTDFAAAVEQQYFDEFIPEALTLARELRLQRGAPRFVWTTGSWLVYEYLERASAQRRREAESAIAAGDLVWHAVPFTFHSELADATTFQHGLSLSKRLDERFGRVTIAAKMTDVPGHTRAIVPLMADAGIRLLHIGRNRASCPPDVPENFVWRHPDGSEIVVVYHHDYGYSSTITGMRSAIAFAHGRDNHPPQDRNAVEQAYKKLQRKYPNAEIIGGTLDDYAREIWAERDLLPVITEELGDTWIHGIASHPERVAAYRAMARLRNRWIGDQNFNAENDSGDDHFSRLLMCVPEHTWGIMVDRLYDESEVDGRSSAADGRKSDESGNDVDRWEGEGFARLRRSAAGRRIEASWEEQLNYVRRAVAALSNTKSKEAQFVLASLRPARPDLSEWTKTQAGERIVGSRFEVRVDDSGVVDYLKDRSTGYNWAGRSHQLGRFEFENFDRDDFDRFARQYLRNKKTTAWWSLLGFTKLGMDPRRAIEHRTWKPAFEGAWNRRTEETIDLLTKLRFPEEAVDRFGAPAEVYVVTVLSNRDPIIHLDVRWFDKRPVRLPAACWFAINPLVEKPSEWMLTKMGSAISPLEVIRHGNRRMHAVEDAHYDGPGPTCRIIPLDSPLCAPGRPSLTDFHQRQPALSRGFWFNLWNNVWNTNFPYWHGGDCRFRFEVRLNDDHG